MGNITSFMHVSLDGFVSGLNGEMNWIKVDQEIFSHVGKRIQTTDTALYGKNTYLMMEGYWSTAADKPNASQHDIDHSKWYKNAHKIVLSTSLAANDLINTTLISDNNAEQLNHIKSGTEKEILLFGSPRATHSLMKLNLIDSLWLFINPVILGKGVRLFPELEHSVNLKFLSSHTFSNGVNEMNYEVVR